MLINELPDDCLLTIFDYLSYLDDLVNCYKVCIKWSYLIAKRTKKVKYLMECPIYASDYVFYEGLDLIDETTLSTLFPNIIVFENSNGDDKTFFSKCMKANDAEKVGSFLRNHESLKGIINFLDVPIEKYCDKLEMLSTHHIEPDILQNGSNMRQLYIGNVTLDDFKRVAHYFPNLEKLHIRDEGVHHLNKGPVFEKLKIAELDLSSPDEICYAFQFMDSCPNLQSAHIYTKGHHFFVDGKLETRMFIGPSRIDWNDLKRLFMKYPNLKHLRLDRLWMYDEHIEQLVHILPELVLLHIHDSPRVTQRAADYVENYCKRYGRSIKFYFNDDDDYNQVASEWPQLSTEDEEFSLGFDFMKHCFLKYFDALPYFLIPIDY
uniref:F-box domain-containing protein n=1 Tax=Tetranychus urticae TaxID=32264 RepID=T1L697_TETUR